jgi:methionine biosynthesis protein MetW
MRSDYKIILDLIPENSKVLDIGCSDGELISLLENKSISAQGVELNQEKVISCLEKGLDVIHGDINVMVEDFPYNQFDYCILTQTIQAVQKPDVLLNTLKKIGKNIIVGFNNSARLSNVLSFLASGSFDSLLKKSDSDQWYNTDYIHPCSIKDFKKLALDLDLRIINTFDVNNQKKFLNGKIPSNLFCREVLFHIAND